MIARFIVGSVEAIADLNIKEAYIVAPVKEAYPIKQGVIVTSISGLTAL
jgi:hypothetical protein